MGLERRWSRALGNDIRLYLLQLEGVTAGEGMKNFPVVKTVTEIVGVLCFFIYPGGWDKQKYKELAIFCHSSQKQVGVVRRKKTEIAG